MSTPTATPSLVYNASSLRFAAADAAETDNYINIAFDEQPSTLPTEEFTIRRNADVQAIRMASVVGESSNERASSVRLTNSNVEGEDADAGVYIDQTASGNTMSTYVRAGALGHSDNINYAQGSKAIDLSYSNGLRLKNSDSVSYVTLGYESLTLSQSYETYSQATNAVALSHSYLKMKNSSQNVAIHPYTIDVLTGSADVYASASFGTSISSNMILLKNNSTSPIDGDAELTHHHLAIRTASAGNTELTNQNLVIRNALTGTSQRTSELASDRLLLSIDGSDASTAVWTNLDYQKLECHASSGGLGSYTDTQIASDSITSRYYAPGRAGTYSDTILEIKTSAIKFDYTVNNGTATITKHSAFNYYYLMIGAEDESTFYTSMGSLLNENGLTVVDGPSHPNWAAYVRYNGIEIETRDNTDLHGMDTVTELNHRGLKLPLSCTAPDTYVQNTTTASIYDETQLSTGTDAHVAIPSSYAVAQAISAATDYSPFEIYIDTTNAAEPKFIIRTQLTVPGGTAKKWVKYTMGFKLDSDGISAGNTGYSTEDVSP